jgi:hypothetical protein
VINWKDIAKIEYRYGLKLYQEYHECEEELNRHQKPNGAEANPLKRADIVRSSRTWAHIVQSLEAELAREKMHGLALFAELEGWKMEALAARRGRNQ